MFLENFAASRIFPQRPIQALSPTLSPLFYISMSVSTIFLEGALELRL
jgi:hypothetical protein